MRHLILAAALLIAGCASAPSTLWPQGPFERDLPASYDDVWHIVLNEITYNHNISTADYQAGLIVTESISDKYYRNFTDCGSQPLDLSMSTGSKTTVIMRDLGDDWTRVRFQVDYWIIKQSLVDRQVRRFSCTSTGAWERYALDHIEDQL